MKRYAWVTLVLISVGGCGSSSDAAPVAPAASGAAVAPITCCMDATHGECVDSTSSVYRTDGTCEGAFATSTSGMCPPAGRVGSCVGPSGTFQILYAPHTPATATEHCTGLGAGFSFVPAA
ncbi:MAG TPA: hypothetical protein VL400_21855 [Polyangiaceae bacterium]|nr:hypothetical protein [Polyangiaceae bacterium]